MHLFRVLATSFLLFTSTGAVEALSYRVAALEDGRCSRRRDCTLVFVATGQIERREIQNLRKFVGEMNQRGAGPQAFVIDSEGGNLAGAFGLGLVLRRIGIPVIVGTVQEGRIGPGFCGSACVFALIGGRSRQVFPGSVVAVHAPQRMPADADLGGEELGETTAKSPREITRILMNYARMMGVDPALITLAMGVPPDERRVLTPAEIRRYRLAYIVK
jgi:hypothetical protein